MLKTVALNMYNVQHLYSIYNVSLNILCAKYAENCSVYMLYMSNILTRVFILIII
jgi:hypothetical protein